MIELIQELIEANEGERSALREIERLLDNEQEMPTLVGPHGEESVLPLSLMYALRQIVHHLALDRAVTIMPLTRDAELSTQEAADILNVSRPFLVKLLEEGNIPFVRLGAHRRVKLKDILEYKKARSFERKRALDELAQMSQDMGLYDQELEMFENR